MTNQIDIGNFNLTDNTYTTSELDFGIADGLGGVDTLKINSAGKLELSYNNDAAQDVRNIEFLDVCNGKANKITIDHLFIEHTETANDMHIDLDIDDDLKLISDHGNSSWSVDSTQNIAGSYDAYVYNDGNTDTYTLFVTLDSSVILA